MNYLLESDKTKNTRAIHTDSIKTRSRICVTRRIDILSLLFTRLTH